MSTKIRIAAGLALAALVLPAAASAQNAQQFEAMFGQLDTDGSGGLTPDELSTMYGGAPANSGPVQLTMVVLDENGDGSLSAQEFTAIAGMSNGQLSQAQLQRLFDHFDLSRNGTIDRSELTTAMKSMGDYQGEASVDEAMAEADLDGNGEVDMEEFKAGMK